MQYRIETRFISTRKWWDPRTWKSGYMEWRIWNMDVDLLYPDEVMLFVQMKGGPKWQKGEER